MVAGVLIITTGRPVWDLVVALAMTVSGAAIVWSWMLPALVAEGLASVTAMAHGALVLQALAGEGAAGAHGAGLLEACAAVESLSRERAGQRRPG